MTEDEAKTKWCPFARIPDGTPAVAVNRPEPYGDVPHCLGSFCMAWREIIGPDPDGMKDIEVGSLGILRLTVLGGYCGLAGKPE